MVLTRSFAAVAVCVVLLAGCAPYPGAAAVVDGEPITETTLAETVEDIESFSLAPPRRVLQALIVSPFWIDAAADAGLGVSEQEGRELLDGLVAEAGGDPAPGEYGPGLLSIARVIAAEQKAAESGQGEELASAARARVAEAEVEVSPRYGEWSGQDVVPLLPSWLVGLPPGIR